jgi:hypothetical protein
VKLREGARLTPEDLAAACPRRIARFKIPRYWRVVESFPMTVTGKVHVAAAPVHPECLAGGVAEETVAGLLELIAAVLAPP